jgi:hypothetical protein
MQSITFETTLGTQVTISNIRSAVTVDIMQASSVLLDQIEQIEESGEYPENGILGAELLSGGNLVAFLEDADLLSTLLAGNDLTGIDPADEVNQEQASPAVPQQAPQQALAGEDYGFCKNCGFEHLDPVR